MARTSATEARLDEVFLALSHRTRRTMLTQLSESAETRVTDLAGRHRRAEALRSLSASGHPA
ncbi:MAG: hypothetical protein R2752_16245 [Vicinamibacterales bacterium]